jgi:hypothetical protein
MRCPGHFEEKLVVSNLDDSPVDKRHLAVELGAVDVDGLVAVVSRDVKSTAVCEEGGWKEGPLTLRRCASSVLSRWSINEIR